MGISYKCDCFLFTEDDFESSGLPFDARYLKNSYVAPWLLPGKGEIPQDSFYMTNKIYVCNGSTSWGSLVNASANSDSSSQVTSFTDPCKGFAFPPPPPGDTRRIGPRRKFVPSLLCSCILSVIKAELQSVING